MFGGGTTGAEDSWEINLTCKHCTEGMQSRGTYNQVSAWNQIPGSTIVHTPSLWRYRKWKHHTDSDRQAQRNQVMSNCSRDWLATCRSPVGGVLGCTTILRGSTRFQASVSQLCNVSSQYSSGWSAGWSRQRSDISILAGLYRVGLNSHVDLDCCFTMLKWHEPASFSNKLSTMR